MAIDYRVFYSTKGAAYRKEKIVAHSAYLVPVDTRPGRLAGNSRIWGDASQEVQRKVIDAIIAAAKKDGFNIRRMAMLLAMAKIESGFNPDAAAGTTSASGLGQFIKKTGAAYGLDASNRFEVGPSISALIAYFKENENIAKKNKDPDYFVYKYHHDGPYSEYGGTALAKDKFAPLAAAYEKALTAGHVLTVVDPGGQPIADAQIKVEQNGKAAVMKTNEHGKLPTFMANPDFGAIQVYIKKADDTFKHLGELAIDKLESMWTLVAPNERVPLNTQLHEPPKAAAAPAAAGTHKVKSGETVSRIARDHETTYQELCKLNGIEKPYTIYPGQVLKLPPKKGAASAKAAPAPTPKPAAPAAPLPGKPTVSEKRDESSQHPVAKVVAPGTGTIEATIALCAQAQGTEIDPPLPALRKARLVRHQNDPQLSRHRRRQRFRSLPRHGRFRQPPGNQTGHESEQCADRRDHRVPASRNADVQGRDDLRAHRDQDRKGVRQRFPEPRSDVFD
ncbi:LysM peptidoglycan-binding domain-containing protein [Massilia sp. TN1-12]|uniref:LysM peptidoglycan-binding domain-containing protein n=1 Tax=Massilia paldalensis TaxID=3377675 RepID=UPI0038501BD1